MEARERRLRTRQLIWVKTFNSAAIGCSLRHRAQGSCGGEVDAGDLDDGLPRGFLVGAIVGVWVALRLNWAGELLGGRGEELPRDVGSERLSYEMVNCLVGVILK